MLKQLVKKSFRTVGFDVVRQSSGSGYPPDFTAEHIAIVEAVKPYTLTSPERLVALIEAVRHVVAANIPGGIVECGVWRGGSMMAAALALKDVERTDRDLYLFDTFEVMTAPQAEDVNFRGQSAIPEFEKTKINADSSTLGFVGLTDVQAAMKRTGYNPSRVHYIKGRVEQTIPAQAPESIALLRLDTDWYESTRHELEHLYPRLSPGGILIIDDYGHWRGSRKATDEYFSEQVVFLNRIDYTGRLMIKPSC
jgi:hypothetical protein